MELLPLLLVTLPVNVVMSRRISIAPAWDVDFLCIRGPPCCVKYGRQCGMLPAHRIQKPLRAIYTHTALSLSAPGQAFIPVSPG